MGTEPRTTEPTTAEERRWLGDNWTIDAPTFRQWVAGSDCAHKVVAGLLDDYRALEAALERTAPFVVPSDKGGGFCWCRDVDLEPSPPEGEPHQAHCDANRALLAEAPERDGA